MYYQLHSSALNSALFHCNTLHGSILLLLNVDDMVITGNNHQGIQRLKEFLHAQFEIKDLGILHYFLRIEVSYSSHGLLLTQQEYTRDIFSCASITDDKSVATPFKVSIQILALLMAPFYMK